MNTVPTLPSDRQLTDAVRTGSDAAWNELLGRHVASVRSMLRTRRQRRALQDGLADLRSSIEAGDDVIEGDPAMRAFRPRAIAAVSGGTYGPHPIDEVVDGSPLDRAPGSFEVDDDELTAIAFARLPEPWQTVLWHRHVEQLTAAEISPLVGRTTLDVAELASTAERGLVDAFLIEYLSIGPLPADSERVISLLGGHVRGTLSPSEQRIVHAHFAQPEAGTPSPEDGWSPPEPDSEGFAPPRPRSHSVDESRRLVGVISSLIDRLPSAIAPGVTGLTVEEHRRALGTSSRSFGSATLLAAKSNRFRRAATVAAVAAVVLVLAGAAYLIRKPFENDDVVVSSDGTPSSSAPPTGAPATDVADDESTETTAPPEVQPTTTALELRPAPTGPRNVIELVAADGSRALGLARAAATDLDVVASTQAPIYAGGSGTIDVAVTNDADTDTEAILEFRVPSGVVFEALVAGDAECADPADDSPFCNVVVAPGATIELALRFGLQSSTVGVFVLDGDLLDEPFEAAIAVTPDLVHSSVARGGMVMLGNSLMTCADEAAAELDIDCDLVRAGVGPAINRWDVPMEFVGTAPQFGVENASAATLELADSATVSAAYLYWSGDLEERQQSIPDDGSNAVVDMVSPDGAVTRVDAEKLILGDVDATQYLGTADVTDIVRAGGTGEYLVGNVQSVEVQGSYAAWSMVVVYDDPGEPRRHRVVTRPFAWIAPQPRFEYSVELPVPVATGAAARLDVFALEGERGFIPEALVIGDELTGGESVFDSTILGERDPSYDNNLGADIDAYDLVIDTPDGTLPISATSEKDGIRLAVLALTVDLTS